MGWKPKKLFQSAVGAVTGAAKKAGGEIERAGQSLNREYKHWGRDTLRDYLSAGYGPALREVGRHNGYNEEERESLSRSFGANYSAVEGAKDERKAAVVEDGKNAALAQRAEQERQKARGQIAARVRRSGRTDRPSTMGGTRTTGALGIPGGGVASPTFASLLGL